MTYVEYYKMKTFAPRDDTGSTQFRNMQHRKSGHKHLNETTLETNLWQTIQPFYG